jgi:hypothetical protein
MPKKEPLKAVRSSLTFVQGFNLPLPTLVEGKSASGRNFKERTVLTYINHKGASFWLDTIVSAESELRLYIDLPSKLAEHDDLKLIINSKVIFIESSKNYFLNQRVSVVFDKYYSIQSFS